MRASSRRSPFNLLSKLVLGIGILVAIGLPSSIVDAKGGSIIIPNSSLQRTVVSSTTTTTTPTTKKHQHGGLVDLKKNQKVIDLSTSSATASALDQRGGGNTDRKDAITGAIILTLIERVVNKILTSNGIKFPSMLGGCIALFFVMILADLVRPGLGGSIYSTLNPGSVFLAKWLPVFFVPGLAMLPLAPSVGSGLEVRWKVSVLFPSFSHLPHDAKNSSLKITPFFWLTRHFPYSVFFFKLSLFINFNFSKLLVRIDCESSFRCRTWFSLHVDDCRVHCLIPTKGRWCQCENHSHQKDEGSKVEKKVFIRYGK